MPKKNHSRKTDLQSPQRPTDASGSSKGVWHNFTVWSVRKRFWQRLGLSLLAFIILITAGMYGVAQWYIRKHQDTPLTIGATFIPDYARYYELDPEDTMTAMITDLGLKRLRLVSYWNDIEAERGTYDFDELDWQMRLAEEQGIEISLALGLRQPRWPECHMPAWAEQLPGQEWYGLLNDFITAVVNRYKDSPALVSYQLENEFFLEVFGICSDFNRDRLEAEFDMVRRLDPDTKLIVNRSNNAVPSWPVGNPRADEVGAAVYKRVWDKTVTRRYFEYPIPAWYYSFLAGMTELTTGRNTFIHELQAEPWLDERFGSTKDAPLEEQYKSMNPELFRGRLEYGIDTGMRTIDLWGAEWWYYLKVKRDAPEMWDTAKVELTRLNQD